ncbi:MAG: gamma-glutamyltransferase [Candidatus Ozemobacteraceae bacterium]
MTASVRPVLDSRNSGRLSQATSSTSFSFLSPPSSPLFPRLIFPSLTPWPVRSSQVPEQGSLLTLRALFLSVICVLLFFYVTSAPAHGQERQTVVSGRFGAVSAGNPRAVAAAVKLLERGGNAVDAAVAAAFALGVVDLSNSGLGGEGFALIRLPNGELEAWDGTIRRPQSVAPSSSTIGLPTEVSLLLTLLEQHGTRCPAEVLSPAIKLARDGFLVSGYLETVLAKGIQRFKDRDALALFAPANRPFREGEKLVQPALANTLISIAADHGAAFYRGELAKQLAEDMAKRGSAYRVSDLAAFHPDRRLPVTLDVGPWRLVGVPPPSSSVVVMALIRELLTTGCKTDDPDSLPAWLAMTRKILAIKHCELPNCVRNPRRFFAMATAAKSQRRNFTKDQELEEDIRPVFGSPVPFDDLNPQPDPLQENTTHLVVWDKNGMVVSMTLTLGLHFGNAEFSPLGFFYSTQMRHYGSISADYPKDYPKDTGPISSKAPLLVLRDGKPVLAIGGAGNNRIITNTAAITAAFLSGEKTLVEAVHSPRAFPEAKNRAVIEWRPEIKKAAASLRKAGWKTSVKPGGDDYFGLVSAVSQMVSTQRKDVSDDSLQAVGDYRRDGSCAALSRDPDDHRSYRFEILAWRNKGLKEIGLVEPLVSPRQMAEGWQGADSAPILTESSGPVNRAHMTLDEPISAIRLVQKVVINPSRPALAPAAFENPEAWMELSPLGDREKLYLASIPAELSGRALVEWLLVQVGEAIPYKAISGNQTPEDLLRRGEGDCSAKAQLMVDMLTRRGIPSRRVGGVLLKNGTKEVTHAWLDVWMEGRWQPVCPVHHLLGRLPPNWLVMRYGNTKTIEGANRIILRVREFKNDRELPEVVSPVVDETDAEVRHATQ